MNEHEERILDEALSELLGGKKPPDLAKKLDPSVQKAPEKAPAPPVRSRVRSWETFTVAAALLICGAILWVIYSIEKEPELKPTLEERLQTAVSQLVSKDEAEVEKARGLLLKNAEKSLIFVEAAMESDNDDLRRRAAEMKERLFAELWQRRVADLPRRWPTARFRIRNGEATWLATLSNERSGQLLRITNSMRREEDEGSVYVAEVRLNRLLTPVSMESEAGRYSGSLQFKEGRAFGEVAGKECSIDITEDTVLDMAIARIVTCMPFRGNVRLRFRPFYEREPHLGEGRMTLQCVEDAMVEIGEQRIPGWKFVLRIEEEICGTFWVSEDRTLLKAKRGRTVWTRILD